MKELWPLEYNKYIFYFMVKHCLHEFSNSDVVSHAWSRCIPPMNPPSPSTFSNSDAVSSMGGRLLLGELQCEYGETLL